MGRPQPEGARLIRVASTESTNAELVSLARSGAPHGTVFFADSQTGGRGRLGRTWVSMRGNVHVSVLLRPALPLQRLPLVALASAVAVAEALGAPYGIKWPNDVLAPDGRKVAGVLAEADTAGGHVAWLVVGVGINLVAAPDLPTATCTRDVDGRDRDAVTVAEDVAAGILRWTDTLACGGIGVLSRWRELTMTLGRRVRVNEIEGIASDVDVDGALIVRTLDGDQRILAGDVELIRSV